MMTSLTSRLIEHWKQSAEGLRRLLTIAGLLLLTTAIGTLGIHFTADHPWFDSAYLAVITLTTLGSQNVPAPGDVDAMLFIMVYLVCGLGIFSYGAFQLGQMIVNAQLRGVWEQRRMQKSIAGLEHHFIVCGQGRMGRSIGEHLQARGKSFVVIDSELSRLEQMAQSEGWLYLHGDATDDGILKVAGIERAESLATALPTDADNLYVTMSARLLAPKLSIVARASDDAAIVKLQRAGATRVISPIHSAGIKMARYMLSPRVEEFLEITDEHGNDLELVEISVAQDSTYAGQRLMETDLRARGMIVVGIRRSNGTTIMAPDANTRISPGDSLFVFGNTPQVDRVVEQSDLPTR
ncbi:MAG: potassium channel family protein [Planctomycetaceae bacterium]